jgi:hypothetical protein
VSTTKTAWIVISLVDQDKEPVPNDYYRIVTSANETLNGHLDPTGKVRVEGIAGGNCRVSFLPPSAPV